MVNKEFKVGHYYKLRDDYPLPVEYKTNICFEGRNIDWWSEKIKDMTGRPIKKVEKTSKDCSGKFWVVFNNACSGGWHYYPEDFIEVDKYGNGINDMEIFKSAIDCSNKALRKAYCCKEENKMELKEIKKSNLKEAKKQFEEERKNEEIEFAKNAMRTLVDEIDNIDRKINKLEEEKKPLVEKLKLFGK